MRKFIEEFKAFALKGNVIDMVGIDDDLDFDGTVVHGKSGSIYAGHVDGFLHRLRFLVAGKHPA